MQISDEHRPSVKNSLSNNSGASSSVLFCIYKPQLNVLTLGGTNQWIDDPVALKTSPSDL